MSKEQITCFEKNGERFANVLTRENLIFTCRTSRIKNKGAAIILLHGFPETSRMWHKLIKVLDSKNYFLVQYVNNTLLYFEVLNDAMSNQNEF